MTSAFYHHFDALVRLTDFDHDHGVARTAQEVEQQRRHHHAKDSGMPRLDLIESKDTMTALVECPGLKKENIDISLHDNVLTISGSTSHVTESQAENSSYKIQERSYGSFARSIAAPPGLKESEIKATLEEGLLKITMPKRAKDSDAKKITIS